MPRGRACGGQGRQHKEKTLSVNIPAGVEDGNRIRLSGELPSAIDLPSGCVFHTRCPLAEARCKAEVPALRDVGKGGDEHLVACHLVKD